MYDVLGQRQQPPTIYERAVIQQGLYFAEVMQKHIVQQGDNFRQQARRADRQDKIIQLIVLVLLVHQFWISCIKPDVVEPLKEMKTYLVMASESLGIIKKNTI